MNARYRTGVIYGHAGDDWTDGAPVAYGPEWHATTAQTDEVTAQLSAIGYDVKVVTR